MAKTIKAELPTQLIFTNPQDVEIGPINQLDLPVQESIIIPGYEDMGTPPDLSIEVPMVEQPIVEEVTTPTIFDRYDKFINQAKDGYLIGFEYSHAMEVLRYCENIKGCSLSLNMSCPTCMLDLLKMFASLKNV